MQQFTNSFLRHWLTRITLIIWAVFVILDYLFHHAYYGKALLEFRYWGLLLLSLILCGSCFFMLRLPPKANQKTGLKINGLGLYLLLLSLMMLVYSYYCSVNNLFTGNPLSHLLFFGGRTIALHSSVFLLFLIAFGIGEPVLNALKGYCNPSSRKLISLAIGLSILGITGVLLGLLNLLNPWILWFLVMAVLILRYRSLLQFLRILLLQRVNFRLGWQGLLTAAVLCIFIAINAIGAIKNFPIGFDGANLYMNTSKLIREYHALPQGGQAFNWSVIMSFGELLFRSTAVSIQLSHLVGVLCLIAVYRVARLFMRSDKALLAAAIFYVAPYISFHNFRDEKVDLGFLFISLSALLLLLEFHFSKGKKEKPEPGQSVLKFGSIKIPANLFVWIIAGWLTGFAFGIKYIAILNFIALIAYLCYTKVGKLTFVGFLGLALGGVFLVRIDRFAGIDLGGISPLVFFGISFLPALVVLVFSFRKNPGAFKKLLYPGALFTAFFILAYAPWAIKHLSENQTFNVSSIIEGKSPRPVITINPDYLSNLEHKKFENPLVAKEATAQFTSDSEQHSFSTKKPRAYFVDQKTEKKLSATEQTRREELHRYLGFESGLPLYLSLPYDLTMNTNFPGHIYLDIGFLFLLLLPLILLAADNKRSWRNFTLFLLLSFIIVMAMEAVYGDNESFSTPEAMKRIDELIANATPGTGNGFAGIYKAIMYLLFSITAVVSPLYMALASMNFIMVLIGLMLLLGLVLWIATDRLKSMPPGLKALSSFLVSFLFFWTFLGNGIPWYAFPALSLLPVLLVYYYANSAQLLGKGQKVFFNYFFGIVIGLYFGMNLISHFHDHNNGVNAHVFLKTPFIRYAGEQLNKRKVLAKFNPFYPSATKIINENLDAKVYRVGTYINYHIKNNDRRVYEDNQLGLFDDITSNTSHPGYFIQTLKENGFQYIVYDLRTASIDKTPEKSLTKKNQAFVHQLLNSGQVELLITDRIVEDPTGNTLKIRGFTFPGKAGLIGNAVQQGSFALFKIK